MKAHGSTHEDHHITRFARDVLDLFIANIAMSFQAEFSSKNDKLH